jgi:very-short-patch-repair endonuclease
LDRAVADLAERQHGVVARGQLLELGMSRDAITRWRAAGRLHRVHSGVYAVGHRRLTRHGRWMAAVLSGGGEAALSHRSAAAFWGILQNAGSRIDVSLPSRSGRTPSAIRLHRVRSLHPDDWVLRDGIPVTSVTRTLVDLAAVVDERRLRRAIEESERLRLFDLRAAEQGCDRARGRRGVAMLRSLLAERMEVPRTRSDLEDLFMDFCREARLPRPAVNTLVAGFEVDAAWPSAKLVVELDSYEYHGSRAAFERDRARDIELKLAGYEVMRLTWRRLETEPARVVAAIRRLLAR